MRELLCFNCGEQTLHTEVSRFLFKCMECGAIRAGDIQRRKPLKVKLIISELDKSRCSSLELKPEEVVKIGEELAVEEQNEVKVVEITAIEKKAGERGKLAIASEIACLWGRAISEITVKIAIQEKGVTRSISVKVPGDREFAVGERTKIAGEELEITAIKIRKGRMMKREGSAALARNIKRIFSKPLGTRTTRTTKDTSRGKA
ncbi:MAG: HVO_0476 family zinc finger protein [Methanocellales archaeon]